MKQPDSAFYDKAWRYSCQNSSLYRSEKYPELWQPFWDQFAPTYLKICRSLLPNVRQMVASWKEKGLLDDGSRVLDIGCGPGTFTLPVAEIAGEAVGLDTAGKMLAAMEEEAQRKEIDNIQALQLDWEEMNCEKEFDLVIAANSPVVCGRESLLKMGRASRQWCLFACYAGKATLTLRNILWKEIMGETMQGRSFDVAFPFNILYQEGYLPRLDYHKQSYCYQERIEQLFVSYRSYFKIFGKKGLEIDRIIRRCIEERAINGHVEEEVSYTMALLWWNVNGE